MKTEAITVSQDRDKVGLNGSSGEDKKWVNFGYSFGDRVDSTSQWTL